MKPSLILSSSFIVILAVLTAPLSAQEWTRLRGPNGQGVSDARTVPVKFGEKDFNWKIKLPGEGHGSPVLWGNKVFVVTADKETADRSLVCLNAATGETLWTKTFKGQKYSRKHQFNHYGTVTPAVDAERVYIYLGSSEDCKVVAVDHAGEQAWEQSLGSFNGNHGPGTSPMLYKEMVIVTHDQIPSGAVYALNKSDGKQRWHVKRNGADNGASYGVPIVYKDADGNEQLIVTSKGNGMTGIDPNKGEVVWELGDLFHMRSVAGPVIADGLLFAQCGSGGTGKRFVAVQPGGNGKDAKLMWETKRTIPYVPTPVAYDGYLYTITDGGQAACYKPSESEPVWVERIGQGIGFFGSPVCVNGHIYAIDKQGRVVVFKATPEKFELLAINELGEMSYATPAVAGGKMYLRTLNHLISVGGESVN